MNSACVSVCMRDSSHYWVVPAAVSSPQSSCPTFPRARITACTINLVTDKLWGLFLLRKSHRTFLILVCPSFYFLRHILITRPRNTQHTLNSRAAIRKVSDTSLFLGSQAREAVATAHKLSQGVLCPLSISVSIGTKSISYFSLNN